MKTIKKLFIIAFCCVLTLTTIHVPSDYTISPLGHYNNKDDDF